MKTVPGLQSSVNTMGFLVPGQAFFAFFSLFSILFLHFPYGLAPSYNWYLKVCCCFSPPAGVTSG